MASLQQLIEEVTAHGRVCPQPRCWNQLWDLLPDRRRVGHGWEPPAPLFLAAWWETSDAEKQQRFNAHLQWAHAHGALDAVATYLNTLEPDDWHTAHG